MSTIVKLGLKVQKWKLLGWSITELCGWGITALAGVSRLATEQPVRRKYS